MVRINQKYLNLAIQVLATAKFIKKNEPVNIDVLRAISNFYFSLLQSGPDILPKYKSAVSVNDKKLVVGNVVLDFLIAMDEKKEPNPESLKNWMQTQGPSIGNAKIALACEYLKMALLAFYKKEKTNQ